MKLILIIFTILMASGCSTMKPLEMSPEQIRERISTGEIIEVGDFVRIVTVDGQIHNFKVTTITADRITGKASELLIADIVSVELREFSGGKTTALVTGIVAVAVVLGQMLAEDVFEAMFDLF